MNDASSGAFYIHLSRGADVVGGLVVKDSSHCMRSGGPKVASIGLVCIQKDHRGKGLSNLLLSAAIEHARDEGFHALTLWTSKWRVYEKHGFALDDRSLYGWATNPDADAEIDPFVGERGWREDIRTVDATAPLPPFANESIVLMRGTTACTVLRDRGGAIVADFCGESDAVAQLLKQALPRRWRLNVPLGDPVLETLARQGISLELHRANLQMWKSLDASCLPAELADMSCFNVLERI
jgi:GNAT superfamily N-acetyltransferase